MKKSLVFVTLAMASQATLAIENGSSLNWSQFSDMATFNCTGTVIGGKYVLTAGHCEVQSKSILFSDGSFKTATVSNNPLGYGNPDGPDISVWTLNTPHQTENIRFLANLNSEPVSDGDIITIYGFAGTQQLKSAQTQISFAGTTKPDWYASVDIGSGRTQAGDSGGAWTNQAGDIVAVHRSGADGTMLATRLSTSRDWLLDEINGWHYPTLATTSANRATITVQSLHRNVTADSAYTDGAITLVGGSCLGNNAISAFDKCTYIVEGSGEGKLYLSANEYVHVNKPKPSIPDGGNTGSGGDSGGGSVGFGLLLLGALGLLRKKK
ncbi:TPA: trypsin-like peptidase domain-containing protein [Vibrio cholerae]|uniref:trypsin-like serine protease n=1 Tax=Vibrio cholerae TaxID=666 RepID=UPI000BA8DC81|nr:trypsin-like serine protease [Vibrio cholerae]EKF9707524.1 trypsin-like peptidase domain-containing protein [Vibrio cholerae]EKF9720696.1 trypsin-like peptidase domain-containing protein [Vibrio cholerae]EKG1750809.1 trypsin-like peptidase domain-containing protein [Vibrio cholerae]ELF5301851.1 trypsin-like peptidase domain-containing protein [Vibrio cholerae]ELL0578431.1 trypsin-like peptidase domain-containing protein [Vibrio cholerae]